MQKKGITILHSLIWKIKNNSKPSDILSSLLKVKTSNVVKYWLNLLILLGRIYWTVYVFYFHLKPSNSSSLSQLHLKEPVLRLYFFKNNLFFWSPEFVLCLEKQNDNAFNLYFKRDRENLKERFTSLNPRGWRKSLIPLCKIKIIDTLVKLVVRKGNCPTLFLFRPSCSQSRYIYIHIILELIY